MELAAQTPHWLWAKKNGGTLNENATTVAVDANHDIYFAGNFSGASTTIGSYTFINDTTNGTSDIFIAKCDPNGNVTWATSIGGNGTDQLVNMVVDVSGNLLVTGNFTGHDIHFGATTLINQGLINIFLAKYNPLGNLVWVKQFGGNSYAYPEGLATDSTGNYYMSGSFATSAIAFDTVILTRIGMRDMFIAKFDSSGNVAWARSKGKMYSTLSKGVSTDDNGNCYVMGSFNGDTVVFGNTALVNHTLGLEDFYLVKYNASGNVVWARSAGGTDSDGNFGNNTIATTSKGTSYITGAFQSDSLYFGGVFITKAGFTDGFTAKYDSAGNFAWAKSIGGIYDDFGYGIALDTNENICVVGVFFSPSFTFGATTLTNLGSYDVFILNYDSSGNANWAKSINGNLAESSSAITIDKQNNGYVAGTFGSSTITFDTISLSHIGGNDAFLAKFGYQCTPDSVNININACESYTSPSGNYNWIASGTYSDTLTNSSGCDSILTINLTIKHNSTASINPVACDIYHSPSGNYAWTSSGSYLDTISNAAGCDSIITINLSIKHNSTASINPVVCESFTSPSGNYTWTNTGIYSDTLANAVGCDSIITVNLTITHNTTATIHPVACDTYHSPSGNYTWTSSGSFLDTIANAAGCDSIITVNLLITHDTTSTVNLDACEVYHSPSGNYTWTSSGVYLDTIASIGGCDSVITFNLSINHSSTASINPVACGIYHSPSGNYAWTSSGIFLDTISNAAGCDSIITVNLTIIHNTASTINPVACDSYLSPSGNYTWTSSGIYIDTIANTAGCDSIITVNLTIHSPDTSVTVFTNHFSANATGAGYQWLNCITHALLPGDTNQVFTPVVNGSYAVIISQNGCQDTSGCFSFIGAGINMDPVSKGFIVYPNPSYNDFTIQFPETKKEIGVTVTDITGKLFFIQKFENTKELHLRADFPPGFYLLEVNYPDGRTCRSKLIKQ